MPYIHDSGVRHDVRNLLSCLALVVEQLEELKSQCGCVCANCQAARRGIARLGTVSRRMGALLRGVEAGVPSLDSVAEPQETESCPSLINVHTVVLDVLEALSPETLRWLTIEIDLPPSIVARARPMDLFRVLFNLIHNCIDVSINVDRPIRLRVVGYVCGPRAIISLRDDGPGMPATVRAAFEMPAMAPHQANRRGQGLPIARWLAERNGGAVRLASSGRLGTTIIVDLPAPQ